MAGVCCPEFDYRATAKGPGIPSIAAAAERLSPPTNNGVHNSGRRLSLDVAGTVAAATVAAAAPAQPGPVADQSPEALAHAVTDRQGSLSSAPHPCPSDPSARPVVGHGSPDVAAVAEHPTWSTNGAVHNGTVQNGGHRAPASLSPPTAAGVQNGGHKDTASTSSNVDDTWALIMPSVPASGAVLVTGGAGFIGSHTVLELLNEHRDVVVVDNLVNATPGTTKPASLERVEKLTGRTVQFHALDILDKPALTKVFKQYDIRTVIHFAALKAVGESVAKPLAYYRNNVNGTLALLDVMEEVGCKSLIFSSSATVYGSPQFLPVTEEHPTGVGITNPYGRSKFVSEEILKDLCKADKEFSAVLLRYFNPVGAHASGEIGEDPNGPPNNLMPFVSQVAVGRRKQLQVFGGDYDTPDGTGVRDYLHVVDLAKGHLAALPKAAEPGCHIFNLGTGSGYSVLQVVQAFQNASGRSIPYQVVARRAGDVPELYADSSKAARELGWRAQLGLDEMCASAWRWQSRNKYGFSAPPAEGDAANGTS